MKNRILAMAAALCCLSCVEIDNKLGSNMIPLDQIHDFYTVEFPLDEIDNMMADSLSGFSSTRITVGAIRDEEFGLTTRSAALSLIPMFDKEKGLDVGTDPVFKSFHFAAAKDTVSVDAEEQAVILQGLHVYELEKPISYKTDFDCNKEVKHLGKSISKKDIIYNGADSLSFDFSEEFGKRFLTLTNSDVKDIDTYLKKFPGIFIDADKPIGKGGRLNLFKLQLGYNSNYQYIEGNYATLNYSAVFNGERKDTSMRFYYGATDFYSLDSLFKSSGTGSFPEFCLNMTGQQTRSRAGKAKEKITIEGGGGLKPVIRAKYLKDLVEKAIIEKGGIPSQTVINKASLVFPFEFPDDYKAMSTWPYRLSPTCRIRTDTTATFMGLTDSSSASENQGDVNRSILEYAPDITYHMQELVKIDVKNKDDIKTKYLNSGNYDIWLLVMANETVTTSTGTSNDMSEYYQYLAYQSYYNQMYGYGGGGGYGGDYYSNYYSYMMMAQMMNTSNTTTKQDIVLDKDRFYRAELNGPSFTGRRPVFRVVFGIPKSITAGK